MGKSIFDKYSKPAPPPADRLNDLFKRYKKDLGLTDKEIGERIGTSAGYVQLKRHKGTAHWSVADVQEMCKVLQITDPLELGEAILNIR
jgi:hypothetical protein